MKSLLKTTISHNKINNRVYFKNIPKIRQFFSSNGIFSSISVVEWMQSN